MNEPKTPADAQRLTLEKIEGCMKLPRKERGGFWYKHIWDYDNRRGYCAFCLIAGYTGGTCDCVAEKECRWFTKYVLGIWDDQDLRKLYAMVKYLEPKILRERKKAKGG